MPESFSSKIDRHKFNFFPAYRGTGGRVTYIADNYREIRIKLPLNLRTRNYVGTIFGGSIYSAIDPFYMLMLMKNLGREYVVWDKAAGIKFKRPGKETLTAAFIITADDLDEIRAKLQTEKSFDKIYIVELKDTSGTTIAEIEKVIYIAKKR